MLLFCSLHVSNSTWGQQSSLGSFAQAFWRSWFLLPVTGVDLYGCGRFFFYSTDWRKSRLGRWQWGFFPLSFRSENAADWTAQCECGELEDQTNPWSGLLNICLNCFIILCSLPNKGAIKTEWLESCLPATWEHPRTGCDSEEMSRYIALFLWVLENSWSLPCDGTFWPPICLEEL